MWLFNVYEPNTTIKTHFMQMGASMCVAIIVFNNSGYTNIQVILVSIWLLI